MMYIRQHRYYLNVCYEYVLRASLSCQDNNSYLAYRWLSNGVDRTYYILEEFKRFASGKQIDLCNEKHAGIWETLVGRNG